MGIPHQLRFRAKKSSLPVPERVEPQSTHGSDGQLEVTLLFTSPEATVPALERTGALLGGLNARINLVALETVPYALALNNPPVCVAFKEQRLRDIAVESPIDTTVHLYICRSPLDTLTSVLKPSSILVVGTRKRWWPTWAHRFARKLESAGFRILLLEFE